MSSIAATRRQVEGAGSLAVLLGAAYAAFEEVLSAIHADEDRVGGSFAGFAFAAAAAADGRDAVAGAPSLPPVRGRRQRPGTVRAAIPCRAASPAVRGVDYEHGFDQY
jgi:hypothetical protein